MVPLVVRDGTGYQVCHCPESKYQADHRPRKKCPTCPFHDLAQVVGACYEPEHAAVGDVVARVSRFSKISKNVVGAEVYDIARNEDDRA